MTIFTTIRPGLIEVLDLSARDCRPKALAYCGIENSCPSIVFAWGPTDDPGIYETAAAILEMVGGRDIARHYSCRFADDVVRKLPEFGWTLLEDDVEGFITAVCQENCEGK